jgi:hypothetical protein
MNLTQRSKHHMSNGKTCLGSWHFYQGNDTFGLELGGHYVHASHICRYRVGCHERCQVSLLLLVAATEFCNKKTLKLVFTYSY